MRCVFGQNHESERDSNITASLSVSWFRAKTQRIVASGYMGKWDGAWPKVAVPCFCYILRALELEDWNFGTTLEVWNLKTAITIQKG